MEAQDESWLSIDIVRTINTILIKCDIIWKNQIFKIAAHVISAYTDCTIGIKY